MNGEVEIFHNEEFGQIRTGILMANHGSLLRMFAIFLA